LPIRGRVFWCWTKDDGARPFAFQGEKGAIRLPPAVLTGFARFWRSRAPAIAAQRKHQRRIGEAGAGRAPPQAWGLARSWPAAPAAAAPCIRQYLLARILPFRALAPWNGCPPYCCQGRIISRRKAGKGRAAADCLLAWYDVHRRDLPLGAQRPGAKTAVSLSGSGSRRSCCSRRPFAAVVALLWRVSGALAGMLRGARSGKPRTRCWAPGAGLWLLLAGARNLHRRGTQTRGRHSFDGAFPRTSSQLRELPGTRWGAYTGPAADLPRLRSGERGRRHGCQRRARQWRGSSLFKTPLPKAKREIASMAQDLVSGKASQATLLRPLMDLGSGRFACFKNPFVRLSVRSLFIAGRGPWALPRKGCRAKRRNARRGP